MKNEDRSLELIAETLQRIDRHQDKRDCQQEQLAHQQEELIDQRGMIVSMQETQGQMYATLLEFRESMVQERPLVRDVPKSHETAIHTLHLTSRQQQDTMQEMTQLLVAQNKKLMEHDERLGRP